MVVLTKSKRSFSISFIGYYAYIGLQKCRSFLCGIWQWNYSLSEKPSTANIRQCLQCSYKKSNQHFLKSELSSHWRQCGPFSVERSSLATIPVLWGKDPANILMVLEFMINLILRYKFEEKRFRTVYECIIRSKKTKTKKTPAIYYLGQ